MKSVKLLLALLIFIAVIMVYLSTKAQNLSENKTELSTKQICVPTFVDGGGPYYKPNVPFRSKIVPEDSTGEKMIVKGKLLRSDCKTAVANAVIDIWQANEKGIYEDNWYRGKITTDVSGNYLFETVKPLGYGEGTGSRPPHIHFKIFIETAEIITSQMFFPDVSGKSGFNDAYIMKLESEERSGEKYQIGYHDIILP